MKRLIGDKAHYLLEERIFHAVCLGLIFFISINIPVVVFLNIPPLSLLLSVVACIAGILYYMSRVKRWYHISSALFQIFVNIALILNYHFNSGINGPTYTIFLVAFLVSVATSPTKQYYIWLPLNMLLIIGLMTMELMSPSTIKTTYTNYTDRFIDMAVSYLALASFAFMVTAYIRKAYNVQREELIAQSEDLAIANFTKNKALSIISHDLREPLATLESYMEFLVDFDIDEEEKKEIMRQLSAMVKNTSMMLANILLWTNGQMRDIRPDKQPLIVNQSLKNIAELTRTIGQSKSISLWIDIPHDITAMADQQMLELIVRNLLMNAIKFTRKGGNIWLSAKIEGNNCIIEVRDDGVGIQKEAQELVFSSGMTSKPGTELEVGTGLGLMLSKEFAELQDGELTFTSEAGKGSTFRLALPNDRDGAQ